jgi:sensor domain CHASE-containing protein
MAHYAFLDENNIVTEVIVGRDEDEIVDGVSDWEKFYSDIRNQKCLRTSYHGNIRKNYAGIGYTYNEDLDAFISPKLFESWVLNSDTCQWEAPIEKPTDEKFYLWNETLKNWVEIPL